MGYDIRQVRCGVLNGSNNCLLVYKSYDHYDGITTKSNANDGQKPVLYPNLSCTLPVVSTMPYKPNSGNLCKSPLVSSMIRNMQESSDDESTGLFSPPRRDNCDSVKSFSRAVRGDTSPDVEIFQIASETCDAKEYSGDSYANSSRSTQSDPLLLCGDNYYNEYAFEGIRHFKLDHSKNMIISHYNINSIRNKFVEISPLLADLDIDILGIAETKIDQSFPSAQFSVQIYKLYRQDRDDRGGGIMVYINDSIPHRLVKEYTGVYMGIDYMTIEISVKSYKWNLVYLYRPPSVSVTVFCEFLSMLCDEFVDDSNLTLLFGDMNCNLFNQSDLCDVCDVFNLTNLIKDPTCFKGDTPTLVDVFLTNKPRSFSGVINTDIGSSDFHNFIGVAYRMHAPSSVKRKVSYRSMKNFCESSFAIDMSHVPFHVCNVFDDVDDIYWAQNLLFTSVLNEHAPLKTRYISKPQVPYMNSELRKAMNQRNMWRSKYFKKKGDHHLRQMYVKWRNKVTKLRKISIQKIFRWKM